MQPDQKTLVFLSPGFAESEIDTCLPLQQSLVLHLKRNYPDVNIVVIAFQYPFARRNYNWHGVPVIAIGGRGWGKLFRLYTWHKVMQQLEQLRQTQQLMGIFSFWLGECAYIGQRFARKHGLKHFCWISGQEAKPGNRYIRMIKPTGNMLVAMSDTLVKSMVHNYGVRPSHLIPGGVEEADFDELLATRNIDILAAGSLIPLKQYHLFLEIVARVVHARPSTYAVLCGDGPLRKDIELKIKKLGLEEHITLTGKLPHNMVLNLMQQSRVFLHPSSYEGLGMVMAEALYAGAKVVSLVKPIEREIQNWHQVTDRCSMTAKVLALLNEPERTQKRVPAFVLSDTAKAILQLYGYKAPAIVLKREAIAENESVAV